MNAARYNASHAHDSRCGRWAVGLFRLLYTTVETERATEMKRTNPAVFCTTFDVQTPGLNTCCSVLATSTHTKPL